LLLQPVFEDWNRLNSTFQALTATTPRTSPNPPALCRRSDSCLGFSALFLKCGAWCLRLVGNLNCRRKRPLTARMRSLLARFWRAGSTLIHSIGKNCDLDGHVSHRGRNAPLSSFQIVRRDLVGAHPAGIFYRARENNWFTVIGVFKPASVGRKRPGQIWLRAGPLGHNFRSDAASLRWHSSHSGKHVGDSRRSLWLLFGCPSAFVDRLQNILAPFVCAAKRQHESPFASLWELLRCVVAQLLTETFSSRSGRLGLGLSVTAGHPAFFAPSPPNCRASKRFTSTHALFSYSLSCSLL